MKIIGISGSPRRGNSYLALDILLEETKNLGVGTELFDLSELTIAPCRGSCHAQCHPRDAKGQLIFGGWRACSCDDDAEEVLEAMVQADAIVMASPVLFGNLSSILKALMERCNALSSFEQAKDTSFLAGKLGGAVAIGGARHGGQERVLASIMHFYLMIQMQPVGLGEYQAPQGLAIQADGSGEIINDSWLDYGIKEASATEYLKAYARKLVNGAP